MSSEPGTLHALRVDAALKGSQFGCETVWADYPDDWGGYKCSPRQWPVISQLEALLEAAQVVASAVADNANDEHQSIPPQLVANYNRRLQSILMRVAWAGAVECAEQVAEHVPSMSTPSE